MSRRTENRFREREVSRALKAARKAHAEVDRVEIDPVSGKISVILAKPGDPDTPQGAAKAWDQATAKLKNQKAQSRRR